MVVTAIMLSMFVIAIILGWEEGNAGYLIPAFLVGTALSIVYLLMEIATSVEKLRRKM